MNKSNDSNAQSPADNDKYSIPVILDTAMKYLLNLKKMHEEREYNEFPKQIFEQAEYMLYVIKELGEPEQYEEAEKIYKKWFSEVSEFTLITWKG